VTLTYLTMDPVAEGVGTSQVARYLLALAGRGVVADLHSFERAAPPAPLAAALADAGVRWHVHPFGALGPRGGLGRVARAARAVRGAELVHARSDLAAAASSWAADRWIWDMRAFFADQRIALGTLRPGSPEDRVLRRVERRAARRAAAIVVLAEAARPVLADRHGPAAAAKARVITTCVDLDLFATTPMPAASPVRYLLAGTLNAYYDIEAMVALVERSAARRPTELDVRTPGATPWDHLLTGATHRSAADPAAMPEIMAATHVGLSVCRADAGVSLRAAMPTKLGELLAVGRPVVVNPGLGDMDAIIGRHRCGVVLGGTDRESLDAALDELDELLADPATPDRCRSAAEAHFDLGHAVDELVALYASLGLG